MIHSLENKDYNIMVNIQKQREHANLKFIPRIINLITFMRILSTQKLQLCFQLNWTLMQIAVLESNIQWRSVVKNYAYSILFFIYFKKIIRAKTVTTDIEVVQIKTYV
jgi:hypothetical protein